MVHVVLCEDDPCIRRDELGIGRNGAGNGLFGEDDLQHEMSGTPGQLKPEGVLRPVRHGVDLEEVVGDRSALDLELLGRRSDRTSHRNCAPA